MIIKKISFLNVRKISLFNENFLPETNIIVGPNGSGKTSVLEAICFLSSGKSFRKKYSKSIIKKGKEELKIQATIFEKEEKRIKIIYNGKKKQIFKNDEIIKTTTELLRETAIVCVSPEEIDVIEEYKKEKQQYFDRIIFKNQPEHIKNIQEYNKLLLYRNALLENKMPTTPWDKKIVEIGSLVWKTRTSFFKTFNEVFNKTQKEINIKPNYEIKYIKTEPTSPFSYLTKLQKETTTPKTKVGPHQDTIELYLNKENIKEHGSQGEKKLLKYILKLAEAEMLKTTRSTQPIILLDDFFAKLDNENIMKIFSYFHRKFQTIITTTNINDQTLKNIQKKHTKIKILNNK